jgi:hypothetical protein
VQSGRGVTTSRPHPALRLKKEYNCVSTPSLDIRGVFYGELSYKSGLSEVVEWLLSVNNNNNNNNNVFPSALSVPVPHTELAALSSSRFVRLPTETPRVYINVYCTVLVMAATFRIELAFGRVTGIGRISNRIPRP